jgi:hypothetical protein
MQNKKEIQESIDNMKAEISNLEHKLNQSDDARQFFIDCIIGCTTEFDGDFIKFNKEGKTMMWQNVKSDVFYMSHDNIWSVFVSKYDLKQQEIRDLTKGILEDTFKWKVKKTSNVQRFE